jgi:hypothetical protein
MHDEPPRSRAARRPAAATPSQLPTPPPHFFTFNISHFSHLLQFASTALSTTMHVVGFPLDLILI